MKNAIQNVPPIGDLSADRIERIARMQEAMQRAASGILMLAMEIGDELTAEKASRPHGAFLPWLRANIESMGLQSQRTAQEYMRLSANRAEIETHIRAHPFASIREAFRVLGRGADSGRAEIGAGDDAGTVAQESEPMAAIPAKAINPRSRRAFAISHMPNELRIPPDQLRAILEWYESEQLTAAYRAANGGDRAKPRKPIARVSAVVKPKAKRALERTAKRYDMTQGELIEQLLAFADQVAAQIDTKATKSNRKGGDHGKR